MTDEDAKFWLASLPCAFFFLCGLLFANFCGKRPATATAIPVGPEASPLKIITGDGDLLCKDGRVTVRSVDRFKTANENFKADQATVRIINNEFSKTIGKLTRDEILGMGGEQDPAFLKRVNSQMPDGVELVYSSWRPISFEKFT